MTLKLVNKNDVHQMKRHFTSQMCMALLIVVINVILSCSIISVN